MRGCVHSISFAFFEHFSSLLTTTSTTQQFIIFYFAHQRNANVGISIISNSIFHFHIFVLRVYFADHVVSLVLGDLPDLRGKVLAARLYVMLFSFFFIYNFFGSRCKSYILFFDLNQLSCIAAKNQQEHGARRKSPCRRSTDKYVSTRMARRIELRLLFGIIHDPLEGGTGN
ncbi:unnamed protein product [Amoebophrya sp. A120]|nr:unnamed protein product [Amoebophrya sp. A120]|eukprot:GSA120T00025720001.1